MNKTSSANKEALLLTIAETARTLGVCRLTVRRMINKGMLSVVWVGAKDRRVTRESIDRLTKRG